MTYTGLGRGQWTEMTTENGSGLHGKTRAWFILIERLLFFVKGKVLPARYKTATKTSAKNRRNIL